jgi:cytidyltransferase-like protein
MSVTSADADCEITRDAQMAPPADSSLSLLWYGGPPPRPAVAPVVVTGVFDVLHPGHIRLLTWAAARGRPLFVGVEDDARVRHRKGPNRPVHTHSERAEVLSALRPVAKVFYIFGVPTLCQGDAYVRLLRQMDPGALAFSEGDPHPEAKRAGAAALGAECLEFPIEAGHSTSLLLERLVHECTPSHNLQPIQMEQLRGGKY